jgi:hypothetical protein
VDPLGSCWGNSNDWALEVWEVGVVRLDVGCWGMELGGSERIGWEDEWLGSMLGFGFRFGSGCGQRRWRIGEGNEVAEIWDWSWVGDF